MSDHTKRSREITEDLEPRAEDAARVAGGDLKPAAKRSRSRTCR
jgi:hypothetical protein